ncbi:MAG: hypothetical protein JSS20_04950 [Proteobacteria bacterium]|nr:hypothetical protein [Pseudomonadota bacterium]
MTTPEETAAALEAADPLDRIVLAAAEAEWRKTAMLIARVVDAAKAQSLEATGQQIAARIYALVEAGRLEAKGNVRRWRASEVRMAGTAE